MSEKIEKAAREIVAQHFCQQLEGLHTIRIQATSGEIKVGGQIDENPLTASNFLRLCFNHGARELHLPTIYVPKVLAHQNIGKTFIARIFEFAEANGYQFFIVNLVPAFYKRLVERGAQSIEFEECVRITPTTNLSPRSKESFANAFGIAIAPEEPVAEAHHWGTLPEPIAEMQDAKILLFIGSEDFQYIGTLEVSANPTKADTFSTIIVIKDLMMGFKDPIIRLRLRLPGEYQEKIIRSSDPSSEAMFSVTVPANAMRPYRPTQLAPEEE
jgi:hypothetical protein